MMLVLQQEKRIQNNGTYSYISLSWCEISFTVSRDGRLERTTCWKRLLLATKEKQQTEIKGTLFRLQLELSSGQTAHESR